MFVLGNVIKPQGLEPLQFPTKFRSPSGVVQAPLGLLLLTTVGFLTALYAIMLMSVERRLLREAARTSRELQEERRQRRDSENEEIRQLTQTLTHELSDIKDVLGRLVSQVSGLRSVVADRVTRQPSEDDAQA